MTHWAIKVELSVLECRERLNCNVFDVDNAV